MTTPLCPDADPVQIATSEKAAWTRPVLDVVDVVATTQAGGVVSADSDPNQPS